LKSSSARGTLIHEIISDVIIKGIEQVDLSEVKSDKNNILWVVDKLKKYMDNYTLISEKPIKFELFGYMISGIPDLIIQNTDKDASREVWDFKTGSFAESKLAPYYFQLYAYAYAGYILGDSDLLDQTNLVLCFVDEKKLVEKTVSFEDVENYLTKEIAKLSSPNQINEASCKYCSYQPICEK
jgi:CRISPR/Cas system-associated exonuclease Cas4 (RecB family)